MSTQALIRIEDLVTQFGEKRVHDHLSFNVQKGSITALIGGSGTGKSTLLKEILGLQGCTSGRIEVFGKAVSPSGLSHSHAIKKRFGVLFQSGALFSALSCGDNIAVPLREQLQLEGAIVEEIVSLKLALVGLEASVAHKMPSELSGGMIKRVALARALATEPELLFLDEPTSGLDPISARNFDHLILTLQRNLDLTIFMVTHDLDSLFRVAQRVIVLGEGRILADGPPDSVASQKHPWIREYFNRQENTK